MNRTTGLRSERGGAAIEFALILTPFLMLTLGMIDYGWWFFVDMACTNAVREGARAATTVPGACPNAAATTLATNTTTSYLAGLIPGSYTPNVDANCTAGTGSPQFTVSLTLDFPQVTGFTLLPMPGGGYGGNTTVSTRAVMRGTN